MKASTPESEGSLTGEAAGALALSAGGNGLPSGLFRATAVVLPWVARVVRQLLRADAWTTLRLVGYAVLARIVRTLAFLLPLKVILLAGTDGVPKYFRAFVDPAHREIWIYALAGLTVFFFLLRPLIEVRVEKLIEQGGEKLVRRANRLLLVRNQREEVHAIFERFAIIIAYSIFCALALAILAIFNPMLLAHIGLTVSASYVLTAWAVGGWRYLPAPTGFGTYVRERTGQYLGFLATFIFMTSFAVLLYPLLTDVEANVLFALIGLVVLRQFLGTFDTVLRHIVNVAQDRNLTNTLLFASHQHRPEEKREIRTLRDLFQRGDRERLVEEKLREAGAVSGPVTVRWADPVVRGVNSFDVVERGRGKSARSFQLQVFSEKLKHLRENEELLFRHVPREVLSAPAVVASFAHGPFDCQICDFGEAQRATARGWKQVGDTLMHSVMIAAPPPGLIRDYARSHLPLSGKLTHELLSRLDIAVDGPAEAKTLRELTRLLPRIREQLDIVPLQITSPDLNRRNVLVGPGGRPVVMGWKRWALAPLGAAHLPSRRRDTLAALLRQLRARRADLPANVTADNLLLAHDCTRFEEAVAQGNFKAALAAGALVVANRALAAPRQPALPAPQNAAAAAADVAA